MSVVFYKLRVKKTSIQIDPNTTRRHVFKILQPTSEFKPYLYAAEVMRSTHVCETGRYLLSVLSAVFNE